MRLHYTPEYRAAVGLLIAGAFLLLTVRVALALFPFPRRQFALAGPLWIDGFFCIYLLLGFPLLTLLQERKLHRRGIFGLDGRSQATPVRHQPDPALALKRGETLRLRSLRLNQQIEQGSFSFSLLLFLIILVIPTLAFDPHLLRGLSALWYHLLQRLRLIASNPKAIPPLTPLAPLEWLVVLAPLGIGFLLPLVFILLRLHPFRETLLADSTGLRWQAPLRRTRAIAWHDIILLTYKSGVQNYCVFSRDEVISFAGPSIAEYVVPNSDIEARKRTAIKQEQADLRFVPPWLRSRRELAFRAAHEEYRTNALRLLATITSRSGQPFAIPSATGSSTAQDYTIDDILSAPLAAEPERFLHVPSATALETAHEPKEVRLEPPLPQHDFFKRALRWSPIFWGIGLVLGGFISPNDLLDPQTLIWLGVFVLVCWLMGMFLAVMMQAQFYRNTHPIIFADVHGLTLCGFNDKVKAQARWDELRAWAIDTTPTHNSPAIYIVTAKGALLTWQEPSDAEQAKIAATLRRVIAEKTGLPLRQLDR